MGSKNKLKKFIENESFSNVIQPNRKKLISNFFKLKGKWNSLYFKNNNPIIIELGCGKGEYTVNLAKLNPNKNYIGIDIKGARIWQGANSVLEKDLKNIGFLRIRIDWIEKCFAKDEVDEIWITFPDPQLKKRRGSKRLTHPGFLNRYANILKKNAPIHLKTDSQFLHGFTLGVLSGEKHTLEDSTHDLYNSSVFRENMEIKTHYEKIYLEKRVPITYLRFQLK